MAGSTIDTLNSITNVANVALTIAGVGAPLVEGVITSIKKIIDEHGQETMDYEVVLKLGSSDLDAADKNYQDTIDAVNAELTRLGKPTI